jgi:PAS domain S-box-containing protein
MHKLLSNRISFVAILVAMAVTWSATRFDLSSLPILLIGTLGCSWMYFYTHQKLCQIDEEHRLLDQIVQNIPGAVFWKNTDSKYLGCNGYFAKFAGYETPDELIDKSEFDLRWKKSEAKRYHLSDLQVMQSRVPVVNMELSYPIGMGKRATLLANKVPLLDDKGNVRGVLGMFQDISAQKDMERALADAKKLESLGQLSAGVAHEINTPMQCVMLNISFIRDSYERLASVVDLLSECLRFADPATSRQISKAMAEKRFDFCREQIPKAIEETNEASQRVVEVVAAMKYLAHPNRDQRHPLDINLLLRNAVTISRNAWKASAHIEFDFESNLPQVPGLQGALTQVLINLISNACDAIVMANRAPGVINISTRNVKDGVQIDFKDNGSGIPEDIISRVFDPFFTTKEVGKGTGQGLAISYDVITNHHHGQITIASTPDVGTTVSIWLPLACSELSNSTIARAPGLTETRSPALVACSGSSDAMTAV